MPTNSNSARARAVAKRRADRLAAQAGNSAQSKPTVKSSTSNSASTRRVPVRNRTPQASSSSQRTSSAAQRRQERINSTAQSGRINTLSQEARSQVDPQALQRLGNLDRFKKDGLASTAGVNNPNRETAHSTVANRNNPNNGQQQESARARVNTQEPQSNFQRIADGSIDQGATQSVLDSISATLPAEQQGLLNGYGSYLNAIQGQVDLAAQSAEIGQDNARSVYQDEQNMLSQFRQNADQRFQDGQDFYRSQRDRQYELLQDERDDLLQDSLDDELEAVELAKQNKIKDIDDRIAILALSGGYGSVNGNLEIADARVAADDAIAKVSREFGREQRNIARDYRQKMVNEDTKFEEKYYQLYQDYRKDYERYDSLGLASRSALAKEETRINENFFSKVSDAKLEHAQAIVGISREANDAAVAERARKYNVLQNERSVATQFFNDAFNNSTDPAYRQRALEMMTRAGFDMRGIDPDNMTIDQQVKLMDMAKKNQIAQTNNPGGYQSTEERDLMFAANRIAGDIGGSDDYKQSLISQVAHFIQQGDYEGAKNELRRQAVSSLNDTQTQNYSNLQVIQDELSIVEEDLRRANESGDTRGIYSKKWQDAQRIFQKSVDPEFLAISARLASISAEEIKNKSGAAVSQQEFERLALYIPQPNDTVQDALGKISIMKNQLKAKNNTLLDSLVGNLGGSSSPSSFGSPQTGADPQGYNNQNILDIINGTSSSGAGSTTSSLEGAGAGYINLGRTTQQFDTPLRKEIYGSSYDRLVKAWNGVHAGIDIAVPKGTDLPSLVGGKVITAENNGGWGNTVVVQEADGTTHRLSHLDSINVSPGQVIAKGDLIGKSGNTGRSTGPHLDYRVRKNGQYVDPTTYQYS